MRFRKSTYRKAAVRAKTYARRLKQFGFFHSAAIFEADLWRIAARYRREYGKALEL